MPFTASIVGWQSDVDDDVEKKQARTLVFAPWVKWNHAVYAALAVPRHRSGKNNGSAEFFRTGGYVQSMQSLDIGPILLALAHQIHCVRPRIDHRSPSDSNLGPDIPDPYVRRHPRRRSRNGPMRGIEQCDVPQGFAVRAEGTVGIQRIHGVMLGGHAHNIIL